MALNITNIKKIIIMSNDGSSELAKLRPSTTNTTWLDLGMPVVVENGLNHATFGMLYTHNGENKFLGFADSVNATEPTWGVGTLIPVTNTTGNETLTIYVVEVTLTNKILLIDKLNELANAIKAKYPSLVLPAKLEQMVYSLGRNVMDIPELSKDAFFYLMDEMAYVISNYHNVESPLTIEEMIAALK